MTAAPALKRFDNEHELTEYADLLNESGLTPEIPLMDSAGICAFGTGANPRRRRSVLLR